LTWFGEISILIYQNMDYAIRKSRFRLFAILAIGVSALTPLRAAAQDAAAQGVTGPLSGYMDFHFNKADGEPGVLDFHRFVLLLNHSFSSRLSGYSHGPVRRKIHNPLSRSLPRMIVWPSRTNVSTPQKSLPAESR